MSASPLPAAVTEAWARRDARQGQGQGSASLHELRAAAMAKFNRLGLPTPQDDSWKYSNLRVLSQVGTIPAANAPAPARSGSWLDPGRSWPTLHLPPASAPHADLPSIEGCALQRLSQLERLDPRHLLELSPVATDSEIQRWLLLNTALYDDGLHVHLTGQLRSPLLILHHPPREGTHALSNSRVIIEADANSRGIIIEHHLDASAAQLCNSASIIHLGRSARLEHYRIFSSGTKSRHLDHLLVRQAADSTFLQHTVVPGSGFVRTTLEAGLCGPGASLDSHTLMAAHGEDLPDCVNLVSHEAPQTRSRQTARLIASRNGRAAFNSKVTVAPGAQKADSVQSCRGLLLSPGAEIDTRPQLEIYADDVKCSHGATTGRLDPDMLFYLLSRGIDPATAQSLLVFAFLADVLTGMSLESVRTAIEDHLVSLLPDTSTLQQFLSR